MNHLLIEGGWYGECQVSGAWQCLLPGVKVRTDRGDVPLIGGDGNPLFSRLALDGVQIAAQDHGGRGNFWWSGSSWNPLGPSYGTNPVAFGPRPPYAIFTGKPEYGAQGIRFVRDDNTVVTVDATYADPSRVIGNYTERGDVTVGQSGFSGVAIYQGVKRELGSLDGGWFVPFRNPQFLIFNREEERLAITVHEPGRGTHFLWLTTSELAQFPVYGAPPVVVPPVDPPKPDPPVEPHPMSCGQIPSAGQAALRALAARPEITALIRSSNDDDRRQATRILAEQLCFTLGSEWGTKDAGGGRPPSKDSLSHFSNGTLCNWDYVNGTTRELVFGEGEDLTGQHFITVTPMDHLGAGTGPTTPPVVTPPATTPPFDSAALEARILAAVDDKIRAAIDGLPKSKPVPDGIVPFIEALQSPGGLSTSKEWGHAHVLRLKS